jgi:sulfate transport system ATP-binding protein
MIEVRQLQRRFGPVVALDDVSLTVARGELVALLGPSGCGKTTLLRTIAGLETPDRGEIWFDGADATGVNVRARRVGFVFQHYALFRHLTVFENVAFGLRIRPRAERPSEEAIRDTVTGLLSRMQLDGLADRVPSRLSGGQRQRVALARALAVEPRVLLLDEPFGALDAQVRRELRRWLRRLHDELGLATVFVTHDQEEALDVADRVVLMNRGRVEQDDSPARVWDEPATAFACGFLGEVNRFAGRADGGRVRLDGVDLPAPAFGSARDTDVVAFVRPHEFEVERWGAGIEGLAASVDRIVTSGPLTRLELEHTASGQSIDALIDSERAQALGLRPGDRLALRPTRARVYPAAA